MSAPRSSPAVPVMDDPNEIVRAMLASAPGAAMLAWDTAHRVVFADGEAFRLVGVDPATLNGHTVRELFPGPAAQEVEAALHVALGGEATELRVRHRVFWWRLQVRPWRDAAGSVVGAFGYALDVTHEVDVESALADTRAGMQRIVHDLPAPALLMDLDSMAVTFANGEFTRTFGWTVGEVLGMGGDLVPRIIHLDDQMMLAGKFAELFQADDHQVISSEFRTRHRDGHWRWVRTRNTVFTRHPDGRPRIMLTVAFDVSERVEAYVALDEAVKALHDAQRVGRVGSWEWLPDSGRLSWTPEMYRIWGLDPQHEAPSYERFLTTIPEPDRSHMVEVLTTALSSGDETFRIDHRLVRPNGEELRVQCRGQVQRDAQGTPIRVTGSSQDVTELRMALEAMGASEERYRLAAQVTNDVLYDYLVSGERVSWNPAMTTTFGHPLDTNGTTSLAWWSSLIHPDDRSRVDVSLATAIAAGSERWQDEYRFRRADGQYALVLDRAYVMRDSDGVAFRLIGSMIDDTARRALDARLRQSAKLDALGTLAGGIAHDFNNILTGILGYAELASHDLPETTDAGDAVRKILVSSRRARDLVRRILTFSRRDEARRERVVLAELVDETHQLVRATLPSTLRVELVIPRDERLATVGDPGLLQQALINLCVNAEHAMRGREDAVLTIRLASRSIKDLEATRRGIRAGAYAVLSVRDNGNGMPPHVAERIFEPFFTTKSVGEGTGLGLAMVHGAVHAAGGAVDVATAPGLGTEFSIYLPRV